MCQKEAGKSKGAASFGMALVVVFFWAIGYSLNIDWSLVLKMVEEVVVGLLT